jgi:recombination protein RecA
VSASPHLVSSPGLGAAALAPRPGEPAFRLDELSGRLVELCGQAASAASTFAFALIVEAQGRGEPVAWVTDTGRAFYPPDAAAWGVDLDALAVVRVPEPAAIARAADQLARSGAFGLVVLDLGARGQLAPALASRLLGLAGKHAMAVVCLTEKGPDAPSLAGLVSLRAETTRTRLGPGIFACTLHVIKDKRRAPGWTHEEVCRGPAGLR